MVHLDLQQQFFAFAANLSLTRLLHRRNPFILFNSQFDSPSFFPTSSRPLLRLPRQVILVRRPYSLVMPCSRLRPNTRYN